MKMADILRRMADKLEQIEGGSTGSESPENASTASTEDDSATRTMTPPLQQKLELLKKATGVPNMFDGEDTPDELGDIKKLSGLQIVHHIDDEPFGE